MAYQFNRAIVGGTFDHFHAGHEKLLTAAFNASEKVIIGVATNELFQHKVYASLIEDFATRKKTIQTFLHDHHCDERAEIVSINDFYGTTLTDKDIEAIFITESNNANVEKINEERSKRGFSQITPVVVSYILDEQGRLITSHDIRTGAIDRVGHNYFKVFQKQEVFILPQEERESLRIPIGTLYIDIHDIITEFGNKMMMIAVGDVVATSLLQNNFQAAISIVDGKTRRNKKIEGIEKLSQTAERQETKNKAGTIAKAAVTSLRAAIQAFLQTNQKQLLVVFGEEDLLAIPAILLSPLQSVVVYGLFGKGIVAVEVTEQKKQNVQNLFRKFQ